MFPFTLARIYLQALSPSANHPPALTHRRLDVAEDYGGEQMETFQTLLIEARSSSAFDDDGNFVFLRRVSVLC
jgi:hypothetical protein